MNEITQTQASALYPQAQPSASSSDELGQADFLQLLVAQLEHQDPAKPMDNFEFLSQIAQFGMVDGITRLEGSFNTVADSFRQGQLAQASSLLGREALAPGGNVRFDGTAVSGQADIPAGVNSILLEIRTDAGALVRSESLPAGLSGEQAFSWDGLDGDGQPLPEGDYKIVVSGEVDGSRELIPVSVMNRVERVVMDEDGSVRLSLSNGEEVSMEALLGVS